MESTLNEITKRIVKEADPDKIILFGSRAKGEEKEESDYDICVLKEGIEHIKNDNQTAFVISRQHSPKTNRNREN